MGDEPEEEEREEPEPKELAFKTTRNIGTCSTEGMGDVRQDECEAACKDLGARNFVEGSWDHSPGCFIVVGGEWKGNCHWNRDVEATPDNPDTRSICMDGRAPAKVEKPAKKCSGAL